MFTNEQMLVVGFSLLALYLWSENRKAKETMKTVHNAQTLDWVDYRGHRYIVNTSRTVEVEK